VVARLATQLVQWSATLVIIRLLDPTAYGMMAMAMAATSWSVMIADLGLTASVMRAAVDRGAMAALQGAILAMNGALCALLVLAAPEIAAFFEAEIAGILRLLALAFALDSLGRLQEAVLIRQMRFRARAAVETSASLIEAAVALGMAASGFGVWSLVGGALARVVVRATLFCIVAGQIVVPSFRLQLAWPHIRFGTAVTFSRTLFWLLGYLDVMIVGRTLTSHDLGVYNVSKSLSLLPVSKFGSILAPLSFTVYAKLAGDPARQRQGLVEAVTMLLLISTPMAAIISATGGEIERAILGPNWVGAGFMLSVMSLAIPCALVITQTNTLLMAAGTMRPVIVNQLMGLVILGTTVGTGASFGIQGATVGWSLGYAIVWVASVVRTRRYTQVGLGDILRIGRGAFLSAAAAFLAIMAARHALDGAVAPLLQLALLVGLGGAVYLAALVVLDRPRLLKLLNFLRA
jgi:O-antigen/teichoic acid export membrane protein